MLLNLSIAKESTLRTDKSHQDQVKITPRGILNTKITVMTTTFVTKGQICLSNITIIIEEFKKRGINIFNLYINSQNNYFMSICNISV